ncbi:MAG TPA: 50S ribosomal protein L30 [Aquificae bacterium]|jgi:large subunit ribosomal protein L30|nr:50S ribosomal protein L30 [Aquificota bacterium]HIP93670.1 50S ribosomal protein L30 [Desulfurobacteriaceae bacterium]
MAKKLKITLVRSKIGCPKKQKLTLEALGLRKREHSTIKPDNPQIRGMIKKVWDLVKVEEIED